MTPKEKAKDLWLTYYELLPDGIYSNEAAKEEAKRFALIAVDEILKLNLNDGYDKEYWQQVKTEIENL